MKCPDCKCKLSMKPTADGTVMFYVCERCGWQKEMVKANNHDEAEHVYDANQCQPSSDDQPSAG